MGPRDGGFAFPSLPVPPHPSPTHTCKHPQIVREANADVMVGDLPVLAGTAVGIPIGHFHYDPALWEEPQRFNPARFARGVAAACKHVCAFMPFITGPRGCIGSQFAMQEARLILATLLRCVTWELDASYVHQPDMVITLRPVHGVPCRVSPRP
jgi:cytochrome P450